MRTLAACLFILLSIGLTANAQDSSPVYITLWLDTEDYILPQSDDAAKRLAELLTRLNVKATFKVVEKRPARSNGGSHGRDRGVEDARSVITPIRTASNRPSPSISKIWIGMGCRRRPPFRSDRRPR